MKWSLDWHPEAIQEARDAYRWYFEQAPSAAERFLVELDVVAEWISTMPQACSQGDLMTRFRLLKTFPYVVHFRQTQGCILVIAVSHTRRQPGYWQTRMEGLSE